MNSFIAWIGGKKLLRKQIIEMFPDNFERYIEVFGGAGWVLFGKEQHAKFEVFNDYNSELVNLYKSMKYHPKAIEEEYSWTIQSREIFNDMLDSNISGLTEIQRASRYLFLIKSSFSASRRTFATRPNNLSIKELEKVTNRLKKVVIENKDFQNLIKVYDRNDALFYLDPPYHKTEKYYDNVFSESDHLRLKETLDGIKGKFILSYNDDEYIRNLYKGYNIIETERNNNIATQKGKEKYKELIIKNY
jgi:DNA adenine methylase